MQLAEALDVAKQVLLDKRVIIVTVLCLVYLEIVHYVVHYKKKPPKVRKSRITVAAAPKPAENSEGESSDEDDSSEASTAAASSAKTSSAKSAPASSTKK